VRSKWIEAKFENGKQKMGEWYVAGLFTQRAGRAQRPQRRAERKKERKRRRKEEGRKKE
jgi:hypothetical protein